MVSINQECFIELLNKQLDPSKKHHYELIKMNLMDTLITDKPSMKWTDMHGAIILMTFALEWWSELGLVEGRQ